MYHTIHLAELFHLFFEKSSVQAFFSFQKFISLTSLLSSLYLSFRQAKLCNRRQPLKLRCYKSTWPVEAKISSIPAPHFENETIRIRLIFSHREFYERTCATYGVIIAPNLAIILQAPTPTALSCVG